MSMGNKNQHLCIMNTQNGLVPSSFVRWFIYFLGVFDVVLKCTTQNFQKMKCQNNNGNNTPKLLS